MIKKALFSLLIFLIFSLSAAPGQSGGAFFVIEENGKSGFIDRTGKVVVEPRFIGCSYKMRFAEDLAVACTKDSDKAGFIDRTGKFVIEQKFADARNFSEGLAVAFFGEYHMHRGFEKAGFVDKTGKIVVEPVFSRAMDFFEGLAAVYKDGRWGYIDKTGKTVIPFKFDYAFSFSGGLARVFVDDKYGYIDRQGNFVVRPQFTEAENFSEGLALVRIGGETIFPYPYLTREIIEILPHPYSTGEMIENLPPGKGGNQSRYAYINQKGKILFEFDTARAGSFSDGLAAIEIENRFGFIDRTGSFVIEPSLFGPYPVVPEFSEGLAVVRRKNDKYGFIDKKGRSALKQEFDRAENFENGLARVWEKTDQSYGYIDKKGRYVWKSKG